MTTRHIRRRSRRGTADSSPAVPNEAPAPNALRNGLHLAIRYVDPATLRAPARRLRKNSTRQLNAIAVSIREFGFLNPILVDGTGTIVCGHARWLVARELGLNEVPVISTAHLSPVQLRLYALAENKCGELGEWQLDELKLEFDELATLTLDTDLSLESSGFLTAEIDLLPSPPDPVEGNSENEGAAPQLLHPVTCRGDLWILGEHRLLCGDALEEASYATLMDGELAQMVFCDPPYNLPATSISGLGKVQHGNFAMASGEMSQAEFTGFLERAFGHMRAYSCDGSVHYQCMDWRHMREMLDAGHAVYSELKNLVVWNKETGGMSAFYRSQHELIFVWKNGTARHINNFGLGEHGRYRTNVWACKGNNSFHRNRQKELATHATVKPLSLVADAIRDCSHRNGLILDAFGGSGTTLHAAEHTGRRARLIELEPRFCDAAITTWQEQTGRTAALAASGQTWREVAQERGIDLDATLDEDGDEAQDWDEEEDGSEAASAWDDAADAEAEEAA